jgi:hypothetical protein
MSNLLITIESRLPLSSCGDSKVPPGLTTLLDTDDFHFWKPGTTWSRPRSLFDPGPAGTMLLWLWGLTRSLGINEMIDETF